jgi:hypothetical protein
VSVRVLVGVELVPEKLLTLMSYSTSVSGAAEALAADLTMLKSASWAFRVELKLSKKPRASMARSPRPEKSKNRVIKIPSERVNRIPTKGAIRRELKY